MRKNKEIRRIFLVLLVMISAWILPQKAFAAEAVRMTGDLKPQEPKLYDSKISTYGAEGEVYSGTDYELFSTLEERVKEAMLSV